MNGRSAKILLSILCGALLLIAGCTAPAPTGEGAPTPTPGSSAAVQPSTSDLGSLSAVFQSMNDRLALIAENTRPEGKGILTGNIVLFDNQGDAAHNIALGNSTVALPSGKCDVALYAAGVSTYTTMEEMKDYAVDIYGRNKQTCLDTIVCRKSVTLDSDFSFLYVTYKPYNNAKSLSQVTLSYRCPIY
jgi:hypothetical protein